ncbi:MAG: trypsin-like peptidase domain-containing protein [Planctomycetaceae bacterium]
MSAEWYYRKGTAVSGPFTQSELWYLAKTGTINDGTFVRRGANGHWKRANQVNGLNAQVSPKAQTTKTTTQDGEETNVVDVPATSGKTLLDTAARLWEQASPHVRNSGLSRDSALTIGVAFVLCVGILLVLFRTVLSDRPTSHDELPSPTVSSSPVPDTRAEAASAATEDAPAPSDEKAASDMLAPTPTENSVADDGVPPPKTIVDIVASTEPAVASIEGKFGSGTGFLIGEGLLATNRHVIDLELVKNLKVRFPSATDDAQGPYTPRLLYVDPSHDLAILSVETTIPPISLAPTSHVPKGEEVVAIGNPGVPTDNGSLINAVSRGLVSTHTRIDGKEFLQLDISINPGNSGGPVIDMNGHVIGIVTLRLRTVEGIAFCEPVDALSEAASICQSQSVEQIDEQRANHRARAVFIRINRAANLHRRAMEIYLSAFTRALKNGTDASEEVDKVRENLSDSGFMRYRLRFSDLEPDVAEVSSDSTLSNSIKGRFVDFWANYVELRSYVDNPRGTVETFREKSTKLFDNHKRQGEALRLLLGIPELSK